MADTADDAQALDERVRHACIAHVRAQVQSEGADDCIDCGDPLNAERRAAMPSACRCVACQELFERRVRLGRP